MTTNARIGYGTLFKVRTATGPDVYTSVGEQTNVTPYALAVDTVDATHMASPSAAREYIAGLIEAGEAAVEGHYVPSGTDEALLFSMLRTKQTCRAVMPSGAYVQMEAFLAGIEPEAPIDDKMVWSQTWKITGLPTLNAAAAPTNSVLPAIAGTQQVGQTLTALEGVWANEPTSFTYQWKAEGLDIAGATSKTYELAAGEEGDNITVVVTATNSAGSASATSGPTDEVAAA
jgi:hypothetical protein